MKNYAIKPAYTLFSVILLMSISGCSMLFDTESRLAVKNGKIEADSLSYAIKGSYEEISSPSGKGLACLDEEGLRIDVRLDNPVSDTATIMMWIRLDKEYSSGEGVKKLSVPLFNLQDTVKMDFVVNRSELMFFSHWDKSIESGKDDRYIIPRIPGPGWLHIAFTWDGPRGYRNTFINGLPNHMPDVEDKWHTNIWNVPEADNLQIFADHFAVADIRVLDRMVSERELSSLVGSQRRKRAADDLGAKPGTDFDPDKFKGELLYQNDLTGGPQMENWILEGPGIIDFDSSGMTMDSAEPQGHDGHFVYWLDKTFPENFVAQWDFRVIDTGLAIVFFAAEAENGRDIFAPSLKERDGTFSDYVAGDILSYHISYFSNTRNQTNLRKNNKFYLLANGPALIKPTDRDWHTITLVKDGGMITLAVDDTATIQFEDKPEKYGPILGAGKIGFRQMKPTKAAYKNLRIYALED